MKRFLSALATAFTRSHRRVSSAASRYRARPTLEVLEGRALPSRMFLAAPFLAGHPTVPGHTVTVSPPAPVAAPLSPVRPPSFTASGPISLSPPHAAADGHVVVIASAFPVPCVSSHAQPPVPPAGPYNGSVQFLVAGFPG